MQFVYVAVIIFSFELCVHLRLCLREDKNRTSLLSHPRVSLLANGTVEMVNISHSDTGNYTCTVQDNNISIVAYLKVYGNYQIFLIFTNNSWFK